MRRQSTHPSIISCIISRRGMELGKCWNRRRFRILLHTLVAFSATYIVFSALWNIKPSQTFDPTFGRILDSSAIKKLMSDEKSGPTKRWKIGCEDCESSHRSVYSRTGLDCRAMFEGDSEEIQKAHNYINTHEPTTTTDDDYIQLTSDCKKFQTERGYFMNPMSEEEAEFPIAFSILVYNDVDQIERLFRAVYMPQNYYCIHIDSKASQSTKTALRAISNCFENVFIASRLESVYWGHISIMYAEMNCIQDLLRFNWKYFINLSGQMFPSHSNAQLVQILRLYDGANDIEGSYNRSRHYFMMVRSMFSWRLSESLGMMLITVYPKGRPPHDVTIYKGSNQVAITRAFAIYFLYSQSAQDIVRWFTDTHSPDEYIWPTLNHNPHLHAPGTYKGDPELKTFTARATIWTRIADQVNWSWNDWPCHGKWVRQICIFGIGDLPWLYQRPELFINKFHSDYQWLTYDCMEELILNRTLERRAFDTRYYQRLPFVQNKSNLVTLVSEAIQFLT